MRGANAERLSTERGIGSSSRLQFRAHGSVGPNADCRQSVDPASTAEGGGANCWANSRWHRELQSGARGKKRRRRRGAGWAGAARRANVGGAHLVPVPERGDDTIGAEAVQALLGRHRLLEHVQADGAHELAVQAARAGRDLGAVGHGILGRAVQLVERQLPGLAQAGLLGRGHRAGWPRRTAALQHWPGGGAPGPARRRPRRTGRAARARPHAPATGAGGRGRACVPPRSCPSAARSAAVGAA